jgi:hypothetical protein
MAVLQITAYCTDKAICIVWVVGAVKGQFPFDELMVNKQH